MALHNTYACNFCPDANKAHNIRGVCYTSCKAEFDCEIKPDMWKLEKNWSQDEASLSKVAGATDIRLALLFKGRLGVGRLETEVGTEVSKLPPVDEDADWAAMSVQASPGLASPSHDEAPLNPKRMRVNILQGGLVAGGASGLPQAVEAASEIAKALSFEQSPAAHPATSLRSAAPPA